MDGGSILSVIGQIKKAGGEQLAERIDKAAGLWYAGQVCYLGSNEWRIFSQADSAESYTVTFNLKWHCNCPDYKHRAPETEFLGGIQQTCKHIIAAGLSWLIDSPEAAQQPHPTAYVTIPGWLAGNGWGGKAVSHDAADMGHQARDAAPPAWFGQNDSIEDMLG